MSESTPFASDRENAPGGASAGDRGDRSESRGYRGDHGDRRDRPNGDWARGAGGRRPRRFRGKVCQFCVDKAIYVDYKDLERLGRYVTERGKILPRRITGNCATHQRMLVVALKRARTVALLPFATK